MENKKLAKESQAFPSFVISITPRYLIFFFLLIHSLKVLFNGYTHLFMETKNSLIIFIGTFYTLLLINFMKKVSMKDFS